ncbi:MAG: hypothetical protein ACOX1P_02110 [Thermoguttaceae bacterium]
MDRVANIQVYDNLVADSNIGCRMHHVNEKGQTGARSAGLDLSRPFELRGREWAPLAGMERGYFKGKQPDLGAVQ